MKTKYSLCLVALFLSACSTVWDKPGATQEEFKKDTYECERDMRQSGNFGTGVYGGLNAQAFNDRCMEARGYTKEE